MNQTVRIIGGRFRGKKIQFPAIEGLRPTPDRVRETLFNWLMGDIYDSVCLDAFAGSGALGFEAFSRGAQKVTLVEQDTKAYANLLKWRKAFDDEKIIEVIKADALHFLANSPTSYTIIFLDPPFTEKLLPICMELLSKGKTLAPDGLVYIESPTQPEIDENLWQEIKLKKAGQVFYGLYKKIAKTL